MGRPSKYSAEFRRDAVALVRDGKVAVKTAARDLGLPPETLRGWVKQDRIDRGGGAEGEITSEEKAELQALRKRVLVLEQERDILKKATALVAVGLSPAPRRLSVRRTRIRPSVGSATTGT